MAAQRWAQDTTEQGGVVKLRSKAAAVS